MVIVSLVMTGADGQCAQYAYDVCHDLVNVFFYRKFVCGEYAELSLPTAPAHKASTFAHFSSFPFNLDDHLDRIHPKAHFYRLHLVD